MPSPDRTASGNTEGPSCPFVLALIVGIGAVSLAQFGHIVAAFASTL